MTQQKTKKELVETGEKVVRRKRGRGGTENFPSTIGSSAKKEDIQRIGTNLLYWYKMPKAVTDEEIQDRLLHFFERCITNGELMTVEKMSLALGYDRKTIWSWETGGEGSTPARRNLIKKAKEILASFDAEMVNEGKINPVTYIFRAKNYFGMKDQQEYVLTPNNPLGDIRDSTEIRERLSEAVIDE